MENKGEIVIFESEDGLAKLNVNLKDENVWLSMSQMAELFDRDRSVISKHIKNIFDEKELIIEGNVQNLHIANSDKPVEFYSLDVIISVGYRVKSKRGVQFRIWATNVLKEYIKKGFALDDDRHYATNNMTAAEVIFERVDSTKPFMGLKTFTGNMPIKKDIKIAKNYLDESELKILNNLVSGYFDLAEVNAIEHKPMHMKDYIENIDSLLNTMKRPIFEGSGKISHEEAMKKAELEYKKYQVENLSEIEKEYLKSIQSIEKKVKKKKE